MGALTHTKHLDSDGFRGRSLLLCIQTQSGVRPGYLQGHGEFKFPSPKGKVQETKEETQKRTELKVFRNDIFFKFVFSFTFVSIYNNGC